MCCYPGALNFHLVLDRFLLGLEIHSNWGLGFLAILAYFGVDFLFVYRAFCHSSQGQRGYLGVCFFFSPIFIYSPKKAKTGDCSWVWNQTHAFTSRVAQDRILDYFPHIDFVPPLVMHKGGLLRSFLLC